MTDQQWLGLTCREFDALLKRKEANDRREDIRAGIIAAAVVNYSMCHPEKMVSPLDFVPGLKKKDDGFDLRTLSPEEQAEYVKKQFAKKIFRRK